MSGPVPPRTDLSVPRCEKLVGAGLTSYHCTLARGHEENRGEPCYAVESTSSVALWRRWAAEQSSQSGPHEHVWAVNDSDVLTRVDGTKYVVVQCIRCSETGEADPAPDAPQQGAPQQPTVHEQLSQATQRSWQPGPEVEALRSELARAAAGQDAGAEAVEVKLEEKCDGETLWCVVTVPGHSSQGPGAEIAYVRMIQHLLSELEAVKAKLLDYAEMYYSSGGSARVFGDGRARS